MVLKEALLLRDDERAELVVQLLDSLPPPGSTDAWSDEEWIAGVVLVLPWRAAPGWTGRKRAHTSPPISLVCRGLLSPAAGLLSGTGFQPVICPSDKMTGWKPVPPCLNPSPCQGEGRERVLVQRSSQRAAVIKIPESRARARWTRTPSRRQSHPHLASPAAERERDRKMAPVSP